MFHPVLRGRSAAEPCEQEGSARACPRLLPGHLGGWGDSWTLVGLLRLRMSPCLSKGAGMNFSVVSSCGCAFALVLLDSFKLQFGVMW